MRKIIITSFVLLVIVTGYNSCYYDIEQELYPAAVACDTTNVTFTADVLSIIEQNCYRCHSAQENQGSVTLEGYDELKVYVDNGKLLNAINHTGGASPMPKDAQQLSGCDRATISRWVLNNSPNN